MSTRGKVGISTNDRVRSAPGAARPAAPAAAPEARKEGCGCGCKGARSEAAPAASAASAAPRARAQSGNGRAKPRAGLNQMALQNSSRAASLARRHAQSSRGKAGLGANGLSAAQTARAANPQLSGRELARALREQRSRKGNAGQKKSEPTGRQRPSKEKPKGGAQDQPWKVAASETSRGQTVTGTLVGRSRKTTGDEPSTCRTVTGTEYLAADIFREFCQAEPSQGSLRVGVSPTIRGNRVTGNEVGRSTKVTGDEPGTCKRVTGTDYVSPDQTEAFCGVRPEAGPAKVTRVETQKGKGVTGSNVGRSQKVTGDEPGAGRQLTGTQYMQSGEGQAPAKVGASATLRGGMVTGTVVGRSGKVTGDEPGSCRNVTGDDYVGKEQYSDFCAATPAPADAKVGASHTLKGEVVTGTMTGRGSRVTGDEPGTCKAITGTPYAGAEQYQAYCGTSDADLAKARAQRPKAYAGATLTGQQPAIGGKMTGDERGACENVSGTPYIGADQYASACPAVAAEPGAPDFPQPMGEAPWDDFSVEAPMHAARAAEHTGSITGTRYEQGQITGPFGMAAGKVTGTEEARFGHGSRRVEDEAAAAPLAGSIDGRVKSRVTGEGMEAGSKITGDDWDRGDRVTGTEGASAARRNPTRRGGPVSSMAPLRVGSRNEDLPKPVSKVTGGSGNTERGSLITYSGGARG